MVSSENTFFMRGPFGVLMKTGLYLRVRNSGPSTGQTVTTGSGYTVWLAFQIE